MRELIIEKLGAVFSRIFPDVLLSETEIEINYPPEEFGDYSTNLALKVAKKLKKSRANARSADAARRQHAGEHEYRYISHLYAWSQSVL